MQVTMYEGKYRVFKLPLLKIFWLYVKLKYFLKTYFQQLKCGFSMKDVHRARYQEILLKSPTQ